ncbi:MAG TPA: hypothetical protein VHT29_14370 [Solirubrobacteraceae bacterium]|nr:hypothetical protein [Solirubrobacteraceae bacterium]
MNKNKLHSNSRTARTSRIRAGRFKLGAALACASLSVVAVPANAAAPPRFAVGALSKSTPAAANGVASPYGEEHRFGGYDPTGTVPGKFGEPVGFAVDPKDSSTSDKNAVYVLDQTVNNAETGELQYRLQKLTSSGALLGTVTLPLQKYSDLERRSDALPMISLAVDSSKHRVYALVESVVDGGNEEFVPVARELVAWSTQPNGKKELVRASGYPEDPLTKASLVAGASVVQPEPPTNDLYAPEGLTVDSSNHDIVIEAQQGVKNGTEGGPTILQRVGTEGSSSGKLDGSWVANTTISPQGEASDGLFTANSGSFGVDLFQEQGRISRLAEVKPNFSTPKAAPLAPDSSGGVNKDEAPSIDGEITVNARSGANQGRVQLGALSPFTSGSPVTQLSNGLYAARFGQAFAGNDRQSNAEPWDGVPHFWLQKESESSSIGNMGIRLFTSSGAVVTTIGGQPQGQSCNVDFAQLAVAAGANGSLFVLTQPNAENGNSDDQVIEFTPGGKGSCPQPSGSLTINGKVGTSFSFPVGETVTFADTVERKGEAPYRFDWVLLNSATLGVEDLTTQIEGPAYLWPAPSTGHKFTQKGTYYLGATMYGDYGIIGVGEVAEIKVK